ncbi:UNVERIFIED_CONTAM: hypothetical protein GTU68_006113, partial [Idotea baltica]|nr:hypothetical protein [Idotea baltica]
VVIGRGEKEKTLQTVQGLWSDFLLNELDRKSLVINLGGGMIGDLSGYAASTYMRGIDFIQIPTTLLSQVDASIGGKVGINFGGIKNLIGVFNQPKLVICNPAYLSTLNRRELASGFAEVIKHGIIKDPSYLDLLKDKTIDDLTEEDYKNIVLGSCKIKQEVVSADEKESGLRKILNFGHTMGHAIESVSLENAYLHGEAISLGIIFASKLSVLKGYISTEEFDFISKLLEQYELPVKLDSAITQDKLFSKLTSDKKNVGGEVRWTILKGLGKADYDIRIDRALIVQAFEALV